MHQVTLQRIQALSVRSRGLGSTPGDAAVGGALPPKLPEFERLVQPPGP